MGTFKTMKTIRQWVSGANGRLWCGFWGSRVDLSGRKEQQNISFPVSGSHTGRKQTHFYALGTQPMPGTATYFFFPSSQGHVSHEPVTRDVSWVTPSSEGSRIQNPDLPPPAPFWEVPSHSWVCRPRARGRGVLVSLGWVGWEAEIDVLSTALTRVFLIISLSGEVLMGYRETFASRLGSSCLPEEVCFIPHPGPSLYSHS